MGSGLNLQDRRFLLMADNPYRAPDQQSTASIAKPSDVDPDLRTATQSTVRRSLLLMLIPAMYNYYEFDKSVVASLPGYAPVLFRTISPAAIFVVAVLIWFGGTRLLELAGSVFRSLLAAHVDKGRWLNELHHSTARVVYLMIPGAFLWLFWVFAFYRVHLNFYVLSWSVGLIAHSLGACWWGPLAMQWYRISKAPPDERSS